jgi:hypothetical protein
MQIRRLCLLALTWLSSDCESLGTSCTEIGCGDGLSITLHPTDEAWDAGSYRFEFTVAGETHVCTLEIPQDLPANPSSLVAVPCEPPLDVGLVPQTVCTEQRSRDAVSETCAPVSDHWILQTSLSGTPDSLRVRVSRDSATILDASRTPKYQVTRPNGPDCEPVCHQSQIDLTFD